MERLFEERKNDGNKEKGWLLNRNWVINVPLETGIATKAQAERALANMHTSDFIGPHGMYLDAMCQSAAMTISTGVMAVAQAQYGYADRALELIERILEPLVWRHRARFRKCLQITAALCRHGQPMV